ncbi:unnamed protein product [Pseudo-nitzschia multistriata]|uniref:IBB domain-containing protein n=1 Tax=Pseudo-nitzschia multistriata TaxID=183589 RepID=A0A448ZNE8_9STRA|nr:unnamed protein product [Pseudo-nitzschia multistriata]
MPTQDSANLRLTPQQREAVERRSRMTQRRQELTSRIRKQKKSKYIQKRRGLQCGGVDVVNSARPLNLCVAEFRNLLIAYCQTPERLLPSVDNFVAKTKITSTAVRSAEDPLVLLEANDEDLALRFLDCLRQQAIDIFPNQSNPISFQSILKILVHLTSISSGDAMESSMTPSVEYYGRHPSTWSELIVSSSSSPTITTARSIEKAPSWLDIFVQGLASSREPELVSLVLGNLVGDDGAAQNVFQAISKDFKSSMVAGLVQSVSPATPTAAWTLTNMIRNDPLSYARTYCSENLLSASLLASWLREPCLVSQTAWMIASLTAREEDAVQYLSAQHSTPEHSPFLSAIVESVQNPLQTDQILPLVQALGNISCHLTLVAPLLTKTAPALVPLLQHILTTTPSRNPILAKAAWVAGCLLVDVGTEAHPSTTVAAPALIPALINRLGDVNEEIGGSMGTMTLEEEREFASSLWNALDVPPGPGGPQELPQNSLWSNHPTQSSPVQLPFALNLPRSTLRSLVRLINSNDSDAVLAGVHVISLLFQRENDHQNLQRILEEEELPCALEQVCDSQMEEAADVAADCLDDYFYNENYDNDELVETPSPSAGGPPVPTTFHFGIGAEAHATNRGGRGRGRGRGSTIPAWMTK